VALEPRSVAVFGPGVIGLELGQALHRLGVRVLMFGRRGHVGHFSDPAVQAYARRTFERELDLELNADVYGIERDGDRVRVRYRATDGIERVASVDYVLAATGRTPNVRGLGLENVASLDARECRFDQALCGSAPIFIAIDAGDDLPICTAEPKGAPRGEAPRASLTFARATARRSPSCSPIRSSPWSARRCLDLAPTLCHRRSRVRGPGAGVLRNIGLRLASISRGTSRRR
jgi:dihydrolipoamide dehydrogenase